MAYPPKSHCPQGHAYNEANTYTSPSGERHCRVCRKDREAQAKIRNAEKRLTPEQRFWAKVDKTPGQGPNGECWEWTAYRDEKGYGIFGPETKVLVKAHRYSYELANGPLDPATPVVRHRCDNPPCVNPAHLLPGTHRDNSQDMIERGRHVSAEAMKTHCPQGHPFSGENLRIRADNGKRVCLTCKRAADKAGTARRRAKAAGQPVNPVDWRTTV